MVLETNQPAVPALYYEVYTEYCILHLLLGAHRMFRDLAHPLIKISFLILHVIDFVIVDFLYLIYNKIILFLSNMFSSLPLLACYQKN